MTSPTTRSPIREDKRQFALTVLSQLRDHWGHADGWIRLLSSKTVTTEVLDRVVRALQDSIGDVVGSKARNAMESAMGAMYSLREQEAALRSLERPEEVLSKIAA